MKDGMVLLWEVGDVGDVGSVGSVGSVGLCIERAA